MGICASSGQAPAIYVFSFFFFQSNSIAVLAQTLSMPVWAVAARMFEHIPFLQALSSSSIRRRRAFTVQALVDTSWAVAVRVFADQTLCTAIASCAIPRLSELHAPRIASLSWSVAVLLVINCPLRDSLSASSLRTLQLSQQDI